MAKEDKNKTDNVKKIELTIFGADLSEVAAIVADEHSTSVMVDGEGVSGKIIVWVGADEYMPAMVNEIVSTVVGSFLNVEVKDVTVATEEGVNWDKVWRDSFTAIKVGERLWIAPPWDESKPSENRIKIVIDPGMAFGTGRHEATALCLELMEKYRGKATLDVGCGSGILAIAAAKLGATRVVGVDNDHKVIDIAKENVRLNGVDDIVEIKGGSADSVAEKFDLVVANLFLTPLLDMAPIFDDRVKNGGYLVVSGVRDKGQAGAVEKKFLKAGFTLANRLKRGEWAALALKK